MPITKFLGEPPVSEKYWQNLGLASCRGSGAANHCNIRALSEGDLGRTPSQICAAIARDENFFHEYPFLDRYQIDNFGHATFNLPHWCWHARNGRIALYPANSNN
jgi:hypothetical protein